jgi:hypothetical protein
MRRRKTRRPTYYEISCLKDGTVIAAHTVRKPSPHILKRDRLRIDEDNVCKEFPNSGLKWLIDVTNDRRIHFQGIIATALNVRRAIRALLLPRLEAMEAELASVQQQLDRIENAIRHHS